MTVFIVNIKMYATNKCAINKNKHPLLFSLYIHAFCNPVCFIEIEISITLLERYKVMFIYSSGG